MWYKIWTTALSQVPLIAVGLILTVAFVLGQHKCPEPEPGIHVTIDKSGVTVTEEK